MNSIPVLGDGDGWILQQSEQYNNVFGWPDQPTQNNPLGTIALVGVAFVLGMVIFGR